MKLPLLFATSVAIGFYGYGVLVGSIGIHAHAEEYPLGRPFPTSTPLSTDERIATALEGVQAEAEGWKALPLQERQRLIAERRARASLEAQQAVLETPSVERIAAALERIATAEESQAESLKGICLWYRQDPFGYRGHGMGCGR